MSHAVARLLNFKSGEMPLALRSAAFYFTVLCGYFFLRPVREAMGVSRGMGDLRWLFITTSAVSLVIVLVFGGVVSRTDRRRFIPVGYGFVVVCLLVFAGLLTVDAFAGGGLIGSDAETGTARAVGYTYYVWLSVISLFVNSLFWSFMVDVFDADQGKRMFAFIGIGGTLGALVGGWATTTVSGLTDSVHLPAGLMLVGAALFAGSIALMLDLDRQAVASRHSRLGADVSGGGSAAPVGGQFWTGLTTLVRSPYLLGIALYIMLMAVSNTLIYFTQASIILESTDTFSQRVGSFAQFDMLAQLATLLTQIFVTTRLIQRLGVGGTLLVMPLVTVLGFAVLAVWPLYGVMMIFAALHRASRYAVSRPARETLFSVVPAETKYKAKPLIDVFLYRGGDVAGAGLEGGLKAAGLTIAGLAWATVPLAGVWGVLCLALGRAQQRKLAGEPSGRGR
ncbi:MFS transporter [bacterium]|nr:MFS transporter [bacterium]